MFSIFSLNDRVLERGMYPSFSPESSWGKVACYYSARVFLACTQLPTTIDLVVAPSTQAADLFL